MGKFPGVGTNKLSKWGGDEGRGQMPHPWDCHLPTLLQSFFINQCIKRSAFLDFNAMVRLQGQQDMLVDSDYIYFFIFCF